jgi:hypothetical protein
MIMTPSVNHSTPIGAVFLLGVVLLLLLLWKPIKLYVNSLKIKILDLRLQALLLKNDLRERNMTFYQALRITLAYREKRSL